jgi:hypothetical protein
MINDIVKAMLRIYLKKMGDIDSYLECPVIISEVHVKNKEGSAKELREVFDAFVTAGMQVHWEGTLCNSLWASPLSQSLLTRII